MLVKTKKVYYCEHCGRHRLTPNSILKHEASCTANPRRICKVCGNNWMSDLLAKYEGCFMIATHSRECGSLSYWTGKPRTLEQLRTDTDGCPVCMLAVIRQCDLNNSPGDFTTFDYQKEHKEYWDEQNAMRDGERGYSYVD